jgi:hypothetical protein
VQQLSNDIFVIVLLQALVDPINHLFVALLLPDSVAAHEHKVAVVLEFVLVRIRVCSDWKLFWLETFLNFVLQVPKSARQI